MLTEKSNTDVQAYHNYSISV